MFTNENINFRPLEMEKPDFTDESSNLDDIWQSTTDEHSVENTLPDVLQPSTMVVVAFLSCEVDRSLAFWTLPTIKSEDELKREAKKRARFRKMGEPGDILSVRYKNMHRGLLKDNKARKKDMENNVEIDMSVSTKNVNLRLGRDKIHMTGVNSLEMAQEVVTLLGNHLQKASDQFEFLNKHPEIAQDFLNKTCGPPLSTAKNSKNSLLQIEDPDPRLSIFLHEYRCLKIHDDLIKFFRYLLRHEPLLNNTFKCDSIHDVIANYSYNIGFRVYRHGLEKLAHEKYGFYASYDPTASQDVVLTLKIDPVRLADRPFRKKVDKAPLHSFRIKKSGNVKQSSPSYALGAEGYEIFRKLICELGSRIVETEETLRWEAQQEKKRQEQKRLDKLSKKSSKSTTSTCKTTKKSTKKS